MNLRVLKSSLKEKTQILLGKVGSKAVRIQKSFPADEWLIIGWISNEGVTRLCERTQTTSINHILDT